MITTFEQLERLHSMGKTEILLRISETGKVTRHIKGFLIEEGGLDVERDEYTLEPIEEWRTGNFLIVFPEGIDGINKGIPFEIENLLVNPELSEEEERQLPKRGSYYSGDCTILLLPKKDSLDLLIQKGFTLHEVTEIKIRRLSKRFKVSVRSM